MGRKNFLGISLGLLCVVLAGCGNEKGKAGPVKALETGAKNCTFTYTTPGYCGKLTWDKPPAVRTIRKATLSFTRLSDDKPVNPEKEGGFTLTVTTFMPEHRHPGADPTVTRLPNGTFLVSNVDFGMAGLWEVRFHLNRPPAKAYEAAFSVRL